jgi:hypothetical protein
MIPTTDIFISFALPAVFILPIIDDFENSCNQRGNSRFMVGNRVTDGLERMVGKPPAGTC